MNKTWNIENVKTGEIVARVERFHRNVGTLANPSWRVWFQIVGNPAINADTRSALAAYMGKLAGCKVKMVEVA